jgi:hypothetical protein
MGVLRKIARKAGLFPDRKPNAKPLLVEAMNRQKDAHVKRVMTGVRMGVATGQAGVLPQDRALKQLDRNTRKELIKARNKK